MINLSTKHFPKLLYLFVYLTSLYWHMLSQIHWYLCCSVRWHALPYIASRFVGVCVHRYIGTCSGIAGYYIGGYCYVGICSPGIALIYGRHFVNTCSPDITTIATSRHLRHALLTSFTVTAILIHTLLASLPLLLATILGRAVTIFLTVFLCIAFMWYFCIDRILLTEMSWLERLN